MKNGENGWQYETEEEFARFAEGFGEDRILTNLLYAGSGSQIDSVFVRGKPVLRGGSFVHHDIGKVLEQCERILARIEKTM